MATPAMWGGDKQRLETLTDGVFAIVMTLLVFDLALPKDIGPSDLAPALRKLLPNFAAYAITFALVGVYWVANHAIFRWVRRVSHELAWLTMLFLACVALLPFTSKLMVFALANDAPLGLLCYGGNLLAIGLALWASFEQVVGHRRGVDQEIPEGTVCFARSRIHVGLGAYLAATGLAFWDCRVAAALFLTVPMLYILPPVQRWWQRRFRVQNLMESTASLPD